MRSLKVLSYPWKLTFCAQSLYSVRAIWWYKIKLQYIKSWSSNFSRTCNDSLDFFLMAVFPTYRSASIIFCSITTKCEVTKEEDCFNYLLNALLSIILDKLNIVSRTQKKWNVLWLFTIHASINLLPKNNKTAWVWPLRSTLTQSKG